MPFGRSLFDKTARMGSANRSPFLRVRNLRLVTPRATRDVANHATQRGPRGRWRLMAAVWLVVGAGVVAAASVHPVLAAAALVTGVLNVAGGGGAVVLFLALTASGLPPLISEQ